MIASTPTTLAPEPDFSLILSAVQDALAEVEIWRQHARSPEEWSAVRRMAAALDRAQQAVLESTPALSNSADSAQQDLLPA